MKRILLTCTFALMVLFSFSQHLSFGAGIGYGTYSMGTLKDFQAWRLQQTALPLKTTENYESSPFYRAEIALNDWGFLDKIGVFYAFSSTGARSTVSDYSGRVDFDALINGNQLGVAFQKDFYSENNWSAGFYMDGSWLLSSLKMTDYLELVSPSKIVQKESYRFEAKGFSAEPGLALKYKMKPLVLQISLGYLLDFSGKLYLEDTKEQWLAVDRTAVEPQWSGLRGAVQCFWEF